MSDLAALSARVVAAQEHLGQAEDERRYDDPYLAFIEAGHYEGPYLINGDRDGNEYPGQNRQLYPDRKTLPDFQEVQVDTPVRDGFGERVAKPRK